MNREERFIVYTILALLIAGVVAACSASADDKTRNTTGGFGAEVDMSIITDRITPVTKTLPDGRQVTCFLYIVSGSVDAMDCLDVEPLK